jgi:L-asparaginase II
VIYAGGELLAEVERSGFVEGFHRGSVAVLDAHGTLVASAGDPEGSIFPRSSNKPMQAVGMLRSGLVLTDPADLAMVSASHSGEPMHITRVRALLASVGLSESDLRTPSDLPLGEAARNSLLRDGGNAAPIYMNCSGKHAGMLMTCVAAGWPLDDYRADNHPLQQRLRDAIEEISDTSAGAVGVDGCGTPVLAMSLRTLAGSFLRLVDAAPGSDERRVADAMRAHPELISGSGADDERLMHGVPGLLTKGGAEGVIAVALSGIGAVALKVDDGAMRARMPVLVSALRLLGCDAPVLTELADVPLLGGGARVGEIRARSDLFSRAR